MGEKIRDIRPIKIGDASLMIELNEGYSANQGRLIHIQNNKFRYLLKEKDFLHLSSMIMRGWSEFEYIKNKAPQQKSEEAFGARQVVSDETKKVVSELRQILVNERYHLLDLQEGLITVLAHPESSNSIEKLLKTNGWSLLEHPYGTQAGYKFLYQMKPFRLLKKGSCHIEIFSQLPCASFTDKTWIPLDRSIQRFVWEDEDKAELWVNTTGQFIYHLCWAVFFNKGFSPFEKQFLKEHIDCLSQTKMQDLLKTVFFGFTQELCDLLQKEQFGEVLTKYYSFCDY